MSKARIAHLAGPNATIQNTPPLVTSNKARARHNLALLFATGTSLIQYRRGVLFAGRSTGRNEEMALSRTKRQHFANGLPPAC